MVRVAFAPVNKNNAKRYQSPEKDHKVWNTFIAQIYEIIKT